jgi:CTP-dependent riboflavin kinase
MSDEIRQRRENRKRFLQRLYDSSENDSSAYVDGYEIAADLGLSRQDAERIARYFDDHGYVVNSSGTSLTLRITAKGIDHVETGFLE